MEVSLCLDLRHTQEFLIMLERFTIFHGRGGKNKGIISILEMRNLVNIVTMETFDVERS